MPLYRQVSPLLLGLPASHQAPDEGVDHHRLIGHPLKISPNGRESLT